MPFTDFGTVGTDVTIDIYDPQNGGTVVIDGITEFEATPITGDLEHHGLNGDDRFATTYRGWTLTFGYDRLNKKMDQYFAERERRYRSGAAVQTVSITQTIAEIDGTVSQYRFSRVDLKQASSGRWNRDDKVTGSITGNAGLREEII